MVAGGAGAGEACVVRIGFGGGTGCVTSAEATALGTGSMRWLGVGLTAGGTNADGREDSLGVAEAGAVTTAGLKTIQDPTPSPVTSKTPRAIHGARR